MCVHLHRAGFLSHWRLSRHVWLPQCSGQSSTHVFLPFFSFSLPSHENCWINKSFHSYLFICYRETKLKSSSVKLNSSKVSTFVVCQTSDQWPWLPITAQKDFSPKIPVSSQRAEDDFNGTQGSACSVGKNRLTLDSVEAADGLSVQGKSSASKHSYVMVAPCDGPDVGPTRETLTWRSKLKITALLQLHSFHQNKQKQNKTRKLGTEISGSTEGETQHGEGTTLTERNMG